MPKYNTFSEYLQDHYFNQIKETLEEYVREYGLRNDDGNFEKSNQSEIVFINVFKVQFTKSELNNIEFKFFIKAMFLLDEGFERRVESFVGKMQGSFKKGFKLKDQVEITDEKDEGVFTQDLVPVMRKEDYDLFATRFLKHFYPEALEIPTKLDISKIIRHSDLKYYSAVLDNDVLGVIYFADDEVNIIDKDGMKKNIAVHPGDVLINLNQANKRGIGATRNTFIHEAVHWFFHRNFFELRQLLDNEQTCTVCYRSSSDRERDEIAWMEKQARALTPRILMPKKQFLIKYREIKHDVEHAFSKHSKTEQMERIVNELAKFFGVSKESAKYRLTDLGIMSVIGVYNFIDGKYLNSFSFKEKFLSDHQTFILSYRSFSRLTESNPGIRQSILEHKLIYINGMLIVNHPKYIKLYGTKYTLTEYALNHAHECALVFTIYQDYEDSLKSKDKCFFLFSSSSRHHHNASVDDDQLQVVMSKVDENNVHFENHRCKMPSDLGGTLKYHMKKCSFSQQDLAYESDVNEKYISQYTSNKKRPTENEIIKMALAMRLSYPYLADLLYKAGLPPICASGTDNSILITYLMVQGRKNLEEAYKMLKTIEREDLLGLSKRYIVEKKLK